MKVKNKEIKLQFKLKSKNQLKRPLQVECFKCSVSFEVKWNTGNGEYSKKNNWGYWTNKKENNNLKPPNKNNGGSSSYQPKLGRS